MNAANSSTYPIRCGASAICALLFLLAVCGGCSKNNNPSGPESNVTVEVDQTLSAAPNTFDVFRPNDADKAVVFLHGGGNTKHHFEYQLGLKGTDDTNYHDIHGQILVDNKAIAVFPQAQATEEAPNAYVWNNYVEDNGHDDKRFLRDLVSYISAHYDVHTFYLAGHSSGGIMASRMWCEEPELFEAFISISGPASAHFLAPETPCAPAQVKSFLMIIGANDLIIRDQDWEAQIWTMSPIIELSPFVVNPNVIGERYFLPIRVTRACDAAVAPGEADAVTAGHLTTWSYCENTIPQQLVRIEFGGHSIESLEAASGSTMLEFVFDFINSSK